MANLDAPRGFDAIGIYGGASFVKGGKRYKKEASVNVAVGDIVVTTGSAEASTLIPLVTTATAGAGNRVTGCVVAIEPVRTNLRTKYLDTSTSGYVYVADDEYTLMRAQEDGDSDVLAVGDIGQGIDFVTGTPDTTFGRSIAELDSDSTGSAGNEQFKLLAMVQQVNNAAGANALHIVKMNYHTSQVAV